LPEITIQPNSNPYIHVNQLTTFSSETWSNLLEAKGDLAILGLKIETNKPVRGFDENWRRF
jgi:hypothetical protein